MYKLLFEKFLQQFIKAVGRKPQTTKELMSIQDDVVRYLNKTKGVPEGPKKPPFQGFTPKVIEGGKSKEGIGTLFKDSPERIAKMKADNKAAAERLRNKRQEAMDDIKNIEDPEDMASGGMARVKFNTGGEGENNIKLASSYSEDWDKWGYQDFKKYESDGGTKSWKDWYNDIYIPMLDKQFGTDFASGGRAGRGLNYLLGEDDQNVRMPSGGLPGLLGE